MRDLLDESHRTVYQSNAEYQAVDRRGAARFEF
jgi:early secretory antigenic target protein ESAT-6